MQGCFRGLNRALIARGRRASLCWGTLSLVQAALPAVLALGEAFGSRYVVQDDARQHVFWMQQYVDPSLFPGSLIADYFRSVAPPGYAALYRAFALLGVEPLLLAKVMPLFLSVATAACCYALIRRATGRPAAGFAVSFILVQNLWLLDALSNATPRAFLHPLFLGGLCALQARSIAGTAVAAALLGLFYPALLLVFLGALVLLALLCGGEHRRLALFGLGAGSAAVLPFLLFSSSFGPVLSRAAAERLPELHQHGRSAFFHSDPWQFWLCGERSGLLPLEWCEARRRLAPSAPILLVPAAALPLLLYELRRRRSLWRPVIVASIGLFFAAHLLLFRLHLPNRYTQHTFRMIVAVAAGTLLVRGLTRAFSRARRGTAVGRALLAPATLGIGGLMLAAPFAARSVAWHGYTTGRHTALYRFLRQRPPDTLIASLDREADNLPSFAERPVLVAREYAIPFHAGYYDRFRRRAVALVQAQYTDDPTLLQAFNRRFQVDYWLVRDDAFTPEYLDGDWRRTLEPATARAQTALEAGRRPILERARRSCTVLKDEDLALLDAACIDEVARAEES